MLDWFDRAGEPDWAQQWPFPGKVLNDRIVWGNALISAPTGMTLFHVCCPFSVHQLHVHGSIKGTKKSDSLCTMPGAENNGEFLSLI